MFRIKNWTKGVNFPFQFDGSGSLKSIDANNYEAENELIGQSIQQILGTELGSRIMRRDFGARLEPLTFQPIDDALAINLHKAVVEALQRWEDRIIIDRVEMREDGNTKGLIIIDILYTIIKNNQQASTEFTFSTQGASNGG